MAISTGNTINSKWRANAYYTTSETNKNFSVTVTLRLENRSNYHYTSTTAVGYYTNGTIKYTGSPSEVGGKAEGGVSEVVASHTYTYTKGTTASSKKISYSITTKGSTAGGTSSGSFTITVPALDRYTITYYPNGGSGSSVTQTKYYGKSVTIKASSTFSRSGYSFLKWNTKSAGTGTSYSSGATYSSNSGLSLYALWKQNYTPPKAEMLKCYRTSSNDLTNPEEDDEGERIFCSVNYTSGYKTAGEYETTTAYIYVNNQLAGTQSVTAGANLTTSFNIAGYSVNNSYEVKIRIGDSTGSTDKIQTIPSATYPIDLLTDNDNVFMGLMQPAKRGQKVSVPELYIGNIRLSANANKIKVNGLAPIKVEEHSYPSRSWPVGMTKIGDLNYTHTPPDGYTVVGIVGAHMSNNSVLIPMLSFYGGQIHGFVRNTYSSSLTDYLYVRFLLIKSELI